MPIIPLVIERAGLNGEPYGEFRPLKDNIPIAGLEANGREVGTGRNADLPE